MPEGETTQVQTSDPWGPAKKPMKMALNAATQAFKGGYGANTGSMVTPWSNRTVQGMTGTMDVANQNANGGMNSKLQSIINNGGFSNEQRGALDNWQKTANSSYDFNANPGSQGVLDSILRDTKDSVNLNAAAAGRYGSGIHQGRMAQDINDQSSQFRMNDYNTFLGRQDAANTNAFNGAQTGLSNMTAAYQGQMQPYQSMMGIGAMDEDLKRRQLDDKARISNLPWDQISKLMAAASGAGSYGTKTATAPGANPFLTGLGNVATGASLFGKLL